MRFLVACAGYPDLDGGFNQPFVRTRSVYYKEHGAEFDVLNFSAKDNYVIDGVQVYSLKSLNNTLKERHYDMLICHQANLRNHFIFLLKYGRYFPKIIFFYHGHEVLKTSKVYSKPYAYQKVNIILKILRDFYDDLKLLVWRQYIERNYKKLWHIYVSNWMKTEFDKWVHPDSKCMENRCFITYNSIGKVFEENNYNSSSHKDYDFVTIRAMLDKSKYAVDIVNNLATLNPNKKFLLVGMGDFFKYNTKADNLDWLNKKLDHSEMLSILNASKCALMPTRTDAQGVMMCEMATFGIPLITSDIPVCHEVFDKFPGIGMINNDDYKNADLDKIYRSIVGEHAKDNRYFYSVVGKQELDIISKIANL